MHCLYPFYYEEGPQIAIDAYSGPSLSFCGRGYLVKRDGVTFDKVLLYVCRLSGYMEAIPLPKGAATGTKCANLLVD